MSTLWTAIGIKIASGNEEFIQQFLPYETVSCFMMSNDMSFAMAHPHNFPGMDYGVPARTSYWLYQTIFEQ